MTHQIVVTFVPKSLPLHETRVMPRVERTDVLHNRVQFVPERMGE